MSISLTVISIEKKYHAVVGLANSIVSPTCKLAKRKLFKPRIEFIPIAYPQEQPAHPTIGIVTPPHPPSSLHTVFPSCKFPKVESGHVLHILNTCEFINDSFCNMAFTCLVINSVIV